MNGNQRFPLPGVSMEKKKANRDDYYPEIDIAMRMQLMDDGRMAAVEEWYDCDCQATMLTVTYANLDIEDWEVEKHVEFLVRNKVISSPLPPAGSPDGIRVWTNPEGQLMWQFNRLLAVEGGRDH